MIRPLFALWDGNERPPEMLVAFWAAFHYDLAFIDDIALACQLVAFQRKAKDLEEAFSFHGR